LTLHSLILRSLLGRVDLPTLPLKEQAGIFSQTLVYQRMVVEIRLQTGMLVEIPRFVDEQGISVQLPANPRIGTQKLVEVCDLLLTKVFSSLTRFAGSAAAFAADEVGRAPCDLVLRLRVVIEVYEHFWMIM